MLIPISSAGMDPVGDQTTRATVPFVVLPDAPLCTDSSTDVIAIEQTTGDRWGELRITMRDLSDARLICESHVVPEPVFRQVWLFGDDVEVYYDGSNEFHRFGDSRDFVALNYFSIEGNSYVWRFELSGPSAEWCGCPAFDLHGKALHLTGFGTSYKDTSAGNVVGQSLAGIRVSDAITYDGTI